MIIKYMTGGWGKTIEAKEVERETEHSVWVNGNRNAKWTSWHKYHNTWEEAKDYLLDMAKRRVKSYEDQLASAKESLSKIEKLEKA